MSTIISFVSQKGGVGKTTSAVNLSMAFAMGGSRVLLVDLDPQSSVRYSFGIEDAQVGTKDLIVNPTLDPEDIILRTKEHENLHFLLSNINNLTDEKEVNRRLAAYDFLSNLLSDARFDYDYIVLDAPASTNNLAINALVAGDYVILPIQCENLAIKSLKRFLSSFHELQNLVKDKEIRLAGILITRFDSSSEVQQRIAYQLYSSLSDSVFKSIIPNTEDIVEASALGQSVITYRLHSIASTSYIRLRGELIEKFDLKI